MLLIVLSVMFVVLLVVLSVTMIGIACRGIVHYELSIRDCPLDVFRQVLSMMIKIHAAWMDIGNGALKELERHPATDVRHGPPARRSAYAIGPVVAIEFHSSSDSPKSSRMHHRD